MPLTRLAAEMDVVGRVGDRLLSTFEMEAQATGSNPDLDGPLADALDAFGLVPIAPDGVVQDVDLAAIAAGSRKQYLDLVEISLLKRLHKRALAKPKILEYADYKEDWGPIIDALAETIKTLCDEYEDTYSGVGVGNSGIAIGQPPAIATHQIDPSGYFPPFCG